MIRIPFIFGLVLGLLSQLTPTAQAQILIDSPFDGCGTMVDHAGCLVFEIDGGGIYELLTADVFVDGDRLHVAGLLNDVCAISCGMTGCITPSLIEPCPMGESLCQGNGGDQMGCTDCPCGNNAPVDSRGGCINSSGNSARLVVTGEANPLDDQLHFDVRGANPITFGILISGAALLPTNPMNPCPSGRGVRTMFADGLRCVGLNVRRHGTRATDFNGDIGLTNNGWGGDDPPAIGLLAQGGFTIGQTRHWQVFYRELITQVCMRGQNTTNAISTLLFPFP